MHVQVMLAYCNITHVLQNSWKWFIYYRCQNVNKPEASGKRSDEGPPKKRLKLASDRAHHFYAPMHAEDSVSYERNLNLLKQEQSKPRPRVEVLKDLMGQTFTNRFDALIKSSDPITASDHVTEFPLLKKPIYVSSPVLFCMYRCIRNCYFSDPYQLICHACIVSYPYIECTH